MAIRPRTRYQVLRRCNFACYYCGLPAPIAVLEIDHVIPRAFGGTDDEWNLVAACRECNAGKSNGVPTPETVARVRAEYCGYVSAFGPAVGICSICRVPITYWPQDGEERPGECHLCNEVICDAYDAGVAHAQGGRS